MGEGQRFESCCCLKSRLLLYVVWLADGAGRLSLYSARVTEQVGELVTAKNVSLLTLCRSLGTTQTCRASTATSTGPSRSCRATRIPSSPPWSPSSSPSSNRSLWHELVQRPRRKSTSWIDLPRTSKIDGGTAEVQPEAAARPPRPSRNGSRHRCAPTFGRPKTCLDS